MTVRDIEQSFCQGVGTLHVVKISAGRTKAGFTGEWNPTEVIAAVTAVHGAILWVPTVENFFDFRDDDRMEIHCLQHREPITEDFYEEGNAF